MKYSSDFFYSNRDVKSAEVYHISDEMIQKIKSLKSNISNESGYYNTMLQWVASDNQHLKTGLVNVDKELNDLFPAMQFITMIAEVKPEFIKRYNVKDYHIGLLRELYLEADDDDDESYISMGFKRPFGNSHVMGDVRDEMIKAGDAGAIKRDNEEIDDYSEEERVLSEFVTILDKFFQEGFDLKIRSFRQLTFSTNVGRREKILKNWELHTDNKYRLHSYLSDWEPDVSFIRNEKIKEILN
jgi:hypothetical protein